MLKYGYIGTKTLINTIMSGESNKQILDPLSCTIRLGLLTFKEIGTKISFANNRMYFQPPNILQGPVRWTYGDARQDLHNLNNPIEKAIQWYDPQENEDIKKMFQLAVKGLKNLKQSYILKNTKVGDSNLVCHSISHYIELLQNKLDNIENRELTSKIEYDNIYLKSLWKDEEISIVNKLLVLALEKKDKIEEYTYTINAIEAVLDDKDRSVVSIVNKISTSI